MEHLLCAIEKLARQVERVAETYATDLEWRRTHAGLATQQDLQLLRNEIMSAISDYAAKVNTAFDEVSTAVDGLVTDVAGLKATIEKLQNTPGTITAEDQALLDNLQSRADALSVKIKALDAETEGPIVEPPVEPPVEGAARR